jgi:hypothetical protein
MQQNIDDIKCNDMPDQAPAGTQRASGIWTYETASHANTPNDTDHAGTPRIPGIQEGRAYGAASGAAPAGTRVLWGYDDVGSHGDDGVIVGTPVSSTWGDEPAPTDPGITNPGATLPGAGPNAPVVPNAPARGASTSTHYGGQPRANDNDNDNRGLSPTRLNVEAPLAGALEVGALGSSPTWSPRPVRLAPMRAEFISSTADLVSPMTQPVSSIAEFFAPATEPLAGADDYSTQEMVLEQTNVPLASSARVAGRELTALPRVDDARFQASYDEDGGQFRPGPPRAYGRPVRATAPLASPVPRRASGQLTRRATGSLAASERTRRTSGQLTRRATSSLAAEHARTSGPLPARATRSLAAPEQVVPSGYLAAAEWNEGQQARGERDTILLILVALFILGVAGVLGFGYLLSLSSVHLTSFLAG